MRIHDPTLQSMVRGDLKSSVEMLGCECHLNVLSIHFNKTEEQTKHMTDINYTWLL